MIKWNKHANWLKINSFSKVNEVMDEEIKLSGCYCSLKIDPCCLCELNDVKSAAWCVSVCKWMSKNIENTGRRKTQDEDKNTKTKTDPPKKEKQQIQCTNFMVFLWPDRNSSPRPTALDTSTLTITPPIRFSQLERSRG